jgi:hypothetical protein
VTVGGTEAARVGAWSPNGATGRLKYLVELLGVGARHGLEGRVTLFHGSGGSAAGRAGEPPDMEGVGFLKLLSKLNGSLIAWGLRAQPAFGLRFGTGAWQARQHGHALLRR